MPLFQISWFVCFQPQLLAKAVRSNNIPSAISAPGINADMPLYTTSRHVSVGGISQILLSFALASRGHPLAWSRKGSRGGKGDGEMVSNLHLRVYCIEIGAGREGYGRLMVRMQTGIQGVWGDKAMKTQG